MPFLVFRRDHLRPHRGSFAVQDFAVQFGDHLRRCPKLDFGSSPYAWRFKLCQQRNVGFLLPFLKLLQNNQSLRNIYLWE